MGCAEAWKIIKLVLTGISVAYNKRSELVAHYKNLLTETHRNM